MNSNLFDAIYSYIFGLVNSMNISGYSITIMGQATTLATWIAITTTIIILGLLFVFLIRVVCWCFNIVFGAFRKL